MGTRARRSRVRGRNKNDEFWRCGGARRLLADLGQIGHGDHGHTVAQSYPVRANGTANPGPHNPRRAHMTSRGPEWQICR